MASRYTQVAPQRSPDDGRYRNLPTSYEYQSARVSYPLFLSLPETLLAHVSFAWHGLLDACRWDTVFRLVYSDSEIRAHVYKSLLLNSLSLTSIWAFDLLLQPLVQDHPKWFHRNMGWFYKVLWLGPVVGVSLYLNSSWCSLIAKRTFTLQYGSRASYQRPFTYSGMLNTLATSAYRAVMVATSVAVSFAMSMVPYVGSFFGFVFLCWVDAFYCFEYIWEARGFSLARRVRHLEERWAYYLAFGFPSAALCMWGSSLANAALFALLFPSFIMMAMHASPLPLDPYNIVPSQRGNKPSDNAAPLRHPSPFVPIRIPVFALVIWLDNWIVRIFSVGTAGGAQHGTIQRARAFSDTSEHIEQGDGQHIQMKSLGPAAAPVPPGATRHQIPRPRRKLD